MSDNQNLNLTCPYCNGPLTVSTRDDGNYYSYNVPDSIECDGSTACGAEWTPTGVLTQAPY